MKNLNSVKYVLLLAGALGINELPLENRSDNWWDMFWHYMAVNEAKRIKNETKYR